MRTCVAGLALALAGFGAATVAHADASTADQRAPAPAQDQSDDFALHLGLLRSHCSLQPKSEHEQHVAWFLAHPESYPRLLAALDPKSPGFRFEALEVVLRFARADGVPAMERVLALGSELTSWRAGQLLGLHPHPSARAALLRQLGSPKKETLYGATLGLMERHDASVCPALLAESGKRAGTPSYFYVFQAAGRLGCIDRAQLEAVARSDGDADLRQLAQRILGNQP